MTDAPAHQPTDTHPDEVDAALQAVRGLLLLAADTHSDAIQALAPEVALFHVDDVNPPPAPAVPAESDLRGDALHDEAVAALIRLLVVAGDPGLQGRAMRALYEMTTPIHFAPVPAPAPTSPGAQRGELG